MQDRYSEFISGVKQSALSPTPKRVLFGDISDIELGFIKKKNSSSADKSNLLSTDVQAFNAEVDSIKSNLASFRTNIDAVQSLYIKSISSTSNERASKMSSDLDQLITSTNSITKTIKQQLDNIKNTTAILQSSSGNPADVRIRVNQHTTLVEKFRDLIREYQDLQTNYKTKSEDKIRRQFKIAKPDATAQEIEDAVQGDPGMPVFAQEIQQQPQAVQDASDYIRQRHADIAKLDKSIRELHQLFVDMSVLVDSQGEMINQIEFNVTASEVYIEQGTSELEKAIRKKRRNRKLAVALTVLILVLAAIIITPIVLALKK